MAYLVFGLGSELRKSLVEAIWLENWVPPKHVLTSWFDNLAIASASENHRFGLRPLTERKDTLSIGSLVIEVLNHLPKTFSAHIPQKVLDVGPRQPVVRIEAETDILYQNGRVTLRRRQFHLMLRYFLRRPLYLHQIEAHIDHLVRFRQLPSHYHHKLLQLFRIPRNESDWHLSLHFCSFLYF